ncbi:MAG: hypothetical protein LUE08_02325 [Akkermansiaceae bacterium]|nr:hypothetical protein [Akkermansiaceae bacterium]
MNRTLIILLAACVLPPCMERQLAAAVSSGAVSQAAVPPVLRVPDQEKARETVETVYSTWRQSMINHNYQAWKETTSESRQVRVRNLAVSEKREFPRSLFEQQPIPPSLVQLKYVGALGGPSGGTLAATYYGRVDMGLGDGGGRNALVLLFVHERGKWRYDQQRLFNLSHLPQVKERLARGDFSVLKEQDGFHPYPSSPPVPPLCRAPQLIGKVFVDAPGRRVTMTINGVSRHEFEDCRMAETISGGLLRGRNTITYSIDSLNGKNTGNPLGIGLFVMPETVGNQPAVCFEHVCDEKDAPQGGSFTFTVSEDMIRSMNPRSGVAKPAPFRPVPLKTKK